MTNERTFWRAFQAGMVWGMILFATLVSLTEALWNFPIPMH